MGNYNTFCPYSNGWRYSYFGNFHQRRHCVPNLRRPMQMQQLMSCVCAPENLASSEVKLRNNKLKKQRQSASCGTKECKRKLSNNIVRQGKELQEKTSDTSDVTEPLEDNKFPTQNSSNDTLQYDVEEHVESNGATYSTERLENHKSPANMLRNGNVSQARTTNIARNNYKTNGNENCLPCARALCNCKNIAQVNSNQRGKNNEIVNTKKKTRKGVKPRNQKNQRNQRNKDVEHDSPNDQDSTWLNCNIPVRINIPNFLKCLMPSLQGEQNPKMETISNNVNKVEMANKALVPYKKDTTTKPTESSCPGMPTICIYLKQDSFINEEIPKTPGISGMSGRKPTTKKRKMNSVKGFNSNGSDSLFQNNRNSQFSKKQRDSMSAIKFNKNVKSCACDAQNKYMPKSKEFGRTKNEDVSELSSFDFSKMPTDSIYLIEKNIKHIDPTEEIPENINNTPSMESSETENEYSGNSDIKSYNNNIDKMILNNLQELSRLFKSVELKINLEKSCTNLNGESNNDNKNNATECKIDQVKEGTESKSCEENKSTVEIKELYQDKSTMCINPTSPENNENSSNEKSKNHGETESKSNKIGFEKKSKEKSQPRNTSQTVYKCKCSGNNKAANSLKKNNTRLQKQKHYKPRSPSPVTLAKKQEPKEASEKPNVKSDFKEEDLNESLHQHCNQKPRLEMQEPLQFANGQQSEDSQKKHSEVSKSYHKSRDKVATCSCSFVKTQEIEVPTKSTKQFYKESKNSNVDPLQFENELQNSLDSLNLLCKSIESKMKTCDVTSCINQFTVLNNNNEQKSFNLTSPIVIKDNNEVTTAKRGSKEPMPQPTSEANKNEPNSLCSCRNSKGKQHVTDNENGYASEPDYRDIKKSKIHCNRQYLRKQESPALNEFLKNSLEDIRNLCQCINSKIDGDKGKSENLSRQTDFKELNEQRANPSETRNNQPQKSNNKSTKLKRICRTIEKENNIVSQDEYDPKSQNPSSSPEVLDKTANKVKSSSQKSQSRPSSPPVKDENINVSRTGKTCNQVSEFNKKPAQESKTPVLVPYSMSCYYEPCNTDAYGKAACYQQMEYHGKKKASNLEYLIELCSQPPINLTENHQDQFTISIYDSSNPLPLDTDAIPTTSQQIATNTAISQPQRLEMVTVATNPMSQTDMPCRCCHPQCHCNDDLMMPSIAVNHIPVGFYKKTAQKYGFNPMDSFFRNKSYCSQFENFENDDNISYTYVESNPTFHYF